MKYITPRRYLCRLRLERIKRSLKITGLSILTAATIGILYICLTSGSDTQRMNSCLKKHDLDYCNKEVK